MANVLYPLSLVATFNKEIDWNTDDIRAVYVLDTYTYSDADDFLDDIDVATNGATATLGSPTLTKTATGFTFDAADTTATPDAAQDIDAIVIYKHTGTASTSHVLAYINVGTGLTFTSDGNPRAITWASNIFSVDNA